MSETITVPATSTYTTSSSKPSGDKKGFSDFEKDVREWIRDSIYETLGFDGQKYVFWGALGLGGLGTLSALFSAKKFFGAVLGVLGLGAASYLHFRCKDEDLNPPNTESSSEQVIPPYKEFIDKMKEINKSPTLETKQLKIKDLVDKNKNYEFDLINLCIAIMHAEHTPTIKQDLEKLDKESTKLNAEAISILNEISERKDVQTLAIILKEDNPIPVKIWAAQALGNKKNDDQQSIITILSECINDKSVALGVRESAVHGISYLEYDLSFSKILELTKHPELSIKSTALQIYQRWGNEQELKPIPNAGIMN